MIPTQEYCPECREIVYPDCYYDTVTDSRGHMCPCCFADTEPVPTEIKEKALTVVRAKEKFINEMLTQKEVKCKLQPITK